jgi:hypothetical protein
MTFPIPQYRREYAMKKLALFIAVLALTGSAAMAANSAIPGQDKVCVLTFATAAEATAGADDTVLSAKYLPRPAAEAQVAKSDGKSAIFDYSGKTETVNGTTYVITNNEEEREFCESAFS